MYVVRKTDAFLNGMFAYGVIPVPPAMSAICVCLFGCHGYFGIGPLNSIRCSGFIS